MDNIYYTLQDQISTLTSETPAEIIFHLMTIDKRTASFLPLEIWISQLRAADIRLATLVHRQAYWANRCAEYFSLGDKDTAALTNSLLFRHYSRRFIGGGIRCNLDYEWFESQYFDICPYLKNLASEDIGFTNSGPLLLSEELVRLRLIRTLAILFDEINFNENNQMTISKTDCLKELKRRALKAGAPSRLIEKFVISVFENPRKDQEDSNSHRYPEVSLAS